MRMSSWLLDDHTDPPLRLWIGSLLARAEEADFAISRIRLHVLDLSARELGRVRRCRVLLGRLDARTLEEVMESGRDGSARRQHLRALRSFLSSGKVEVRSAGLAAWSPDFSILRGLEGAPAEAAAFVGAHYFARPYPIDGLALTCLITAPGQVARLRERFEDVWEQGYDVADIVRDSLEQLDAELGQQEGRAWSMATP
jgi:hypothetical protein